MLRILTKLSLRMRHAAELRGRELVAPLEGDAELARAVVADGGGDFDDGKPGFAQQLGGAAHAVLEQILMQRTAVGLPEAVLERGRGDVEACGELADGERVSEMREHVVAHLTHELDLIAFAAGLLGRQRQQRTVRAEQVEQLGGLERAVATAFLGLKRLERGENRLGPGGAAQDRTAAPCVQALLKPCGVERQAAEQ